MYIGPWQDYLMLRRHRLAGLVESLPQKNIQPPPPQIRRPLPTCPTHHKDHGTPIYTSPLSMPSGEKAAKSFVFAGVISKSQSRRRAHGGKRTLSSPTATPARQRFDTVAKMKKAWLSSVEIEDAERKNLDGGMESVMRERCSDDAACFGQGEGERAEKDDEREESTFASQNCEKGVEQEMGEDDLLKWVQGLEFSDAEDG